MLLPRPKPSAVEQGQADRGKSRRCEGGTIVWTKGFVMFVGL